MSMKQDVRVVVVGDAGTGKTSLVTSFAFDEFPEQVPSVAPEARIAPDATPDQVSMRIIDTSSDITKREETKEKLRSADVVCVIYAVNDDESFKGTAEYWLPLIVHDLKLEVPVIVIGNKIDVRGADYENEHLAEYVYPLMEEYKTVETCMECSAKEMFNVHDTFVCAQKAVLYPEAPLFDPDTETLKPKLVAALRRIHRLADTDCDGSLSDGELNQLQVHVFNAPLDANAVREIKALLQESTATGVCQNGVTAEGFIFLHQLFISEGKLDTTWAVLRKYGYNDDVELANELTDLPDVPEGEDRVHELTRGAVGFLSQLFDSHSAVSDGLLDSQQVAHMFSVCGEGAPPSWSGNNWRTQTLTNAGCLELVGFIALWKKLALLQPKLAAHRLAYLGWSGEPQQAVESIYRSNRLERTTFRALVLSTKEVESSALVGSLVRRTFSPNVSAEAVRSFRIKGKEVCLVLTESRNNDLLTCTDELESGRVSNLLQEIDSCDVVCVCYETDSAEASMDQLRRLQTLLSKHNVTPPLLLLSVPKKHDEPSASHTVACKAKTDRVHARLTSKWQLPVPLQLFGMSLLRSTHTKLAAQKNDDMRTPTKQQQNSGGKTREKIAPVFARMVLAAQHPDEHTPTFTSGWSPLTYVLLGVGFGAICAGGAYWWLRSQQRPSTLEPVA